MPSPKSEKWKLKTNDGDDDGDDDDEFGTAESVCGFYCLFSRSYVCVWCACACGVCEREIESE